MSRASRVRRASLQDLAQRPAETLYAEPPTTSDGTTTDDPGTTTAVATSTTNGDTDTDTGAAGE